MTVGIKFIRRIMPLSVALLSFGPLRPFRREELEIQLVFNHIGGGELNLHFLTHREHLAAAPAAQEHPYLIKDEEVFERRDVDQTFHKKFVQLDKNPEIRDA